MKKRFTASMLSMALVLTQLVGCGTPSSKKADKPAEPAAEPVTLQVLDFKVNAADNLAALAREYSETHPGVTVELEVVNDFKMIRQARFAAGSGPDLFAVTGYVDFMDHLEYAEDLSDEPWVPDLFEAVKPGISSEGKIYGFPMAIESYGFIYNKDLFAQAGIEKAPETLSELRDACERLKAAGIPAFGEAYKDAWRFGQHLFSMPFALESDPAALIESINKGEKTISNGAYMNGFFDVFDLTLDYGAGKDSIAIDYDANAADFMTGKIAMFQDGIWFWNMFNEAGAPFDIDMFAVPMSDNAAEAKLPVDVPGYLVVNKNGNIEAAKDYLNWLYENADRYYLDAMKVLPPFESVEVAEASPLDRTTLQYSADGMTIPWSFLLWPSGAPDQFGVSLQKYIDGQLTRGEAMEEMTKSWHSLMQ